MNWFSKFMHKLFCRNTIKIHNAQVREVAKILDTLSGERVDDMLVDMLSRTLSSDEIIFLSKKYKVDPRVFARRLAVCKSSIYIMLQQVEKYDYILYSGHPEVLDDRYIQVTFKDIPSLLLELIKYDSTPAVYEDMLMRVVKQMDYVRKVRRDLFLINKNSPHNFQ